MHLPTKNWIISKPIHPFALFSPLLFFVFAYIALTPSLNLIPALSSYDQKRLLECALLVFGAVSLLTNGTFQQGFTNTFLGFGKLQRSFVITIFGLGLLSALFATDVQKALVEVSLFLLLFINCLLISVQWQKYQTESLQAFGYALLISAGFYLIAFLSAYLAASINGVSAAHWDLFVNFSHVRFLSQFQSWTLPLIVLPVFLSNRFSTGLGRWLFIFIASGWWLILFSSGTRGTLLGLIVAGIVTVLAFGRRVLPWFKWQAGTMCLGLLLYCLLFLLPPLLGGMDTTAIQHGTVGRTLTHPHGRFHLWEVALGMIEAHPVLGIGPMQYACGVTNGIAAHPHNAVLQLAAEWGLPVVLMITVLWVSGIRAWVRLGRDELAAPQRTLSHSMMIYPALLASLITASTHALFSGIIVMPLSQVAMILVIACMLGIYLQRRPQRNAPAYPPYKRLIWLLIIIFAITALITGILPDLTLTNDVFNATHIPSGAGFYMPRFWQQGLICG